MWNIWLLVAGTLLSAKNYPTPICRPSALPDRHRYPIIVKTGTDIQPIFANLWANTALRARNPLTDRPA